MPAATKTTDPLADTQAGGLEAKKVALGYTDEEFQIAKMQSDNVGDYIAKFVSCRPEYKDKYFAFPDKDDVINRQYLGWTPLKLDTAKHTVKEVASIEDATRRGSMVLCWKPMRRYELEQAEWAKKQARFNRFVAEESDKSQAIEINNSLNSITGGQISASPIGREKDD